MDDEEFDNIKVFKACCFLLGFIGIIALVSFMFIWQFIIQHIRHRYPHDIKMAVTHASLTHEYFNITNSSNSNYYNLDLNITLRNPNKYFRIDYDKGLLVADYHNTSAVAQIAVFQQPPKNTTLLTPSFKLQRDDNITDHNAAAGSGKGNHFDILVRLYFPKTFKTVSWWRFDSASCSLMFACDLKEVPLQNGSQSDTTAFNSTKCQSRYTSGPDYC